ncbi:hypothetical protein ElyMa_003704200 [Elysia marginata]|uniref:Chitin-binding type-2 domain-containing protein n=1 Tax=Elysia marginata TaxID=1093978 RepID=A0AAV4F334_9GAST|nr:hypothetical protein ElyMa_003704200 [Elysia marginata]
MGSKSQEPEVKVHPFRKNDYVVASPEAPAACSETGPSQSVALSTMTLTCSAAFLAILCISFAYSHGCTKLPASAAFRGTCYFQYVHGRGFVKRSCPPGTRFSEVHCGCIRASVSWISGNGNRFLPSLLSVLRARSTTGFEQTSRDDDDESSGGFELSRAIRSRINQILYGNSKSSYDDEDDFNDDNEKEKDEDDGRGGLFSFFRKSTRGRERDDDWEMEEKDDDNYNRRKEADEDDERGSLFRFFRRSDSGGDRDDDRENEDKDDDDYTKSQLRNKYGGFLGGDDKDEIDREDRTEDDNDYGKSGLNSANRNNYKWWDDGSSGFRANRGDSPVTTDDGEYGDDHDEQEDDSDDNGYLTYGSRFSTKFLMTKGKKYRFEDILDSGLDEDENEIVQDFGGIFEKRFYGLFEYVDDILDDVFDDDFDDFYNDLFDDDGYDDIFAPKYAHYFKDSDDYIEEKYEDFEDFFENYSKMSSMDEEKVSYEDRKEYGGDDRDDDKENDDHDKGNDDGDYSAKQSGVWSGRSGFDVYRNGYGDDRGDDVGERDKRLFNFATTLKGEEKSKAGQGLSDIDSILERFYDN